jgi:hypothetical protein
MTRQLNRPSDIDHLVIPAKTEIHKLQGLFWIPALRSAPAGMTNLVSGLKVTLMGIMIPAS